MNLSRLFVAALFATTASVAGAANFTVSTPTEFQDALTTAQANGESDSITVAVGTYNLTETLTYTADVNENFSLLINGGDSTAVTLDGGSQLPILRIDTTAVTNDDGVFVEVRNMTFRNGNALGVPADGGALAIVMDDANQPAVFATIVAVTGSEFYDNAADGNGGAVYIRSPAVEGIYLDDLTFDGNSAGGSGGAAYVEGRFVGTPIGLSNIDFFNNTAQASGGALYAGGFDVDSPPDGRATTISLYDITFYNNQSFGGGASDGGGGADLGASSAINIALIGFIDNQARTGGGLRIRPNFSDVSIVNCGFTGNTASEDGGAIWASESLFTFFTITNNTIYANTATNRGGGAFIEFDNATSSVGLYNNIVFANTAQGDGDDLYINNFAIGDQAGLVTLSNNIITDFTVTPGPVTQADNIDQDPLLADINARPAPDPRLLSGSPAIDTGLNTAPSAPTTDFEFDARPFDGDGDTVATIDIGIDEFTGAVVQNADLVIAKTGVPDPVTEGNNITYTVTVTNDGPGAASSVSMIDTLAGLLTYVSATPSQGSCAEASGVVTCSLGSLANGASATVTIVAGTPDVADTTVVTNNATVSGAETDPNAANNSVTLDTTIVPAGAVLADLAVTKEGLIPTFGPNLIYDIAVTNNGPDGATGVVLTDTLPALLDFDSADATVGTCTHDGGVVTCNIGALANGASSDITIRVLRPIVETDTDVTNTVTVTATEEDPTPGNNTASVTSTVSPPVVDLILGISSAPAEPLVNEPITYDISVFNAEVVFTTTATGVVVTIDLPLGVTLVSVTPDQGTCDTVKGTITCSIGEIAGGVTTNIEVVVTAPGETGAITLSASVSTDTSESNTDNNASSSAVVVIDVIDIVVEGTSEGSGSVGWIELLALLGATALVACLRRSRRHVATLALVAVLPVAGLLAASDAQAQGDWYMGAAIGQADIDYSASDLTSDLDGLGWTIEGATVDNDGTAWKIYGGWSVSDFVAVELGWVDLGKVDTRYSTTIPPDQIDDILADTFNVHPLTGDGFTAAAVLKWPVTDDFAVHAKAGVFAWNSDVEVRVVEGGTGQVAGDDDGTDAMYGVGIEWKLNGQWSLTAEWERYQLNEWLDVPTVGVRFTF